MKKQSQEYFKKIIKEYDICYVADKDKFSVIVEGEEILLTDIAFLRFFGTKLGITADDFQLIFEILNDMKRLVITRNTSEEK